MQERGVSVGHSTINRWAIRFLPVLEQIFRRHKRAVDKEGNTIVFLLGAKRDTAAATGFFKKAMRANGNLETVTMDKSGAKKAAMDEINSDLEMSIEVRQNKYLNRRQHL